MTRETARSEAIGVWLRLMKAYNLILREARRSVEPRVTLPQFDVLAQLARRPEGMTFVDLSRSLLVSAGNLTGIARRLEAEGLVARETHETDRRAARLRLTAAGRRLAASLASRHARDIERLFASTPRGEVARLRRLLEDLARRLEPDGRAGPGRTRTTGGVIR